MTQEKNNNWLLRIGKTLLILLAVLLFAFIGIAVFFSVIFALFIPTSEVINKDDVPLTLGEVWTVDDQFSIWIDSIEEVSAENAQAIFHGIENTEDKRYFDITFSFQNINFGGCYHEEELYYDYLNVRTGARACDENGESVYPAPLKGYDKNDYGTTWQDGVKIPVTPGLVSTDNHIIVEIGNASAEQIQPSYFAVRFVVPTEILSSEAWIQYRRDYIVPVP
ncbi:MAG: hypothetical protein IJA90_00400 [Peptococcaceae bacterium]|nr:hypothetical protein [Peptococcaceae bacterium]